MRGKTLKDISKENNKALKLIWESKTPRLNSLHL